MKTKKILLLLIAFFLITLIGCGKEEPNTEDENIYYTVLFDSCGGTEVESTTVLAGNPIPKPENPLFEGFTFKGWYKTAEAKAEDVWDFDKDRVTENITLYAGWRAEETTDYTESLTFELENGTYIVTGVGDDTVVIVPGSYNGITVIAIGEAAFARKDITKIILPDTIVQIRLNAFHNCSDLETVYISENSSLASIANNAFSGNSSLKSIYIPKSMTTLGDSVFNNCGSIERFIVSSENEVFSSLGDHLIEKETMTLIRGSNNEEIPEGVKIVLKAAFRRNIIEEIIIPASVELIEDYVFDDCANLERIIVSDENKNYSSSDGILYNKERTALIEAPVKLTGDIVLPASLIEIPNFAFDGRSEIEILVIPGASLTKISNFSFRNTSLIIDYKGTKEEWEKIEKTSLWGGDGLTVLFEDDKEEIENILVAYFSRTGNTKEIAENIAELTGADIVEILPEVPYVENYSELLTIARNELSNNSRPDISDETLSKINIENYKTIFICYPIWHGYEPMIIRSFIENYDNLSNKTVYPVSTSGSSSGTGGYNSIKNICINAEVPSFLHFTSSQLQNSKTTVSNWINELGLARNETIEGTKIKMSFNGSEIFITLIDNSATQDLVERLKQGDITLEFSDYASTEKIAYPNPSLDVADVEGCDPIIGDVTIYIPWGNIAIFYKDSSGFSSSLTKLGAIDNNGIEALMEQNGTFSAILSLNTK